MINIVFLLYLLPKNYAQDIGKKLIKKIEDFATTLPIKKLVITSSIIAHQFYYKLGYRYKDGKKELNDENMYIMAKIL